MDKGIIKSIKNIETKQSKIKKGLELLIDSVNDLSLKLSKSQESFDGAEKIVIEMIKAMNNIKVKIRRNKRAFNTLEDSKNSFIKKLMIEHSLSDIKMELNK